MQCAASHFGWLLGEPGPALLRGLATGALCGRPLEPPRPCLGHRGATPPRGEHLLTAVLPPSERSAQAKRVFLTDATSVSVTRRSLRSFCRRDRSTTMGANLPEVAQWAEGRAGTRTASTLRVIITVIISPWLISLWIIYRDMIHTGYITIRHQQQQMIASVRAKHTQRKIHHRNRL